METLTHANILIVEDEAAIAMELQSRLLDLGYEVSGPVASSEATLQLMEKQTPDLVLMDIRIQGTRDGIETAVAIRANHDIPIIFLTANADTGTLQRAKLTEPVGFLTKPFREREVQAMIEMGLYKHRAETEIRQLNAELEARVARRTAELATANAELKQLISFAAHDLQEPLRPIVVYTQMLAKRYQGQLDADADEMISFIVQNALRLKNLEMALLQYAELNQGEFKPEFTDSQAMLAKALRDLEPTITAKGAIIQVNPLPHLWADARQLRRVFYNLLDNALKFNHAHPPHIVVSAEHQQTETQSAWVMTVRDNGIGIEPQYFNYIFERFKRLHVSDTYTGVGIGLALCKRIIERHDGQIWVESQEGHGSTFSFSLPEII